MIAWIKLVIHPIILWVLLLALSVPEPLLKVTVMLSNALSCQLLHNGQRDEDGLGLCSRLEITTVLGIIFIPVWANILGII